MKSKRLFIFIILIAFFVILANVLIVNAFWFAVIGPARKNEQNQIEIGKGKSITTKITLSSLEGFQNKLLVPKNSNLPGFIHNTDKEVVDEITFKKKIVWNEIESPHKLDNIKRRLRVSHRFYLKNRVSLSTNSIYRLFKFEILNNDEEITLNDPNGVDLNFKFSYNVQDPNKNFELARSLYNDLYLNDVVFELTFEVLLW